MKIAKKGDNILALINICIEIIGFVGLCQLFHNLLNKYKEYQVLII
jgi:hypothetical protein